MQRDVATVAPRLSTFSWPPSRFAPRPNPLPRTLYLYDKLLLEQEASQQNEKDVEETRTIESRAATRNAFPVPFVAPCRLTRRVLAFFHAQPHSDNAVSSLSVAGKHPRRRRTTRLQLRQSAICQENKRSAFHARQRVYALLLSSRSPCFSCRQTSDWAVKFVLLSYRGDCKPRMLRSSLRLIA